MHTPQTIAPEHVAKGLSSAPAQGLSAAHDPGSPSHGGPS